MKYLEEMDKLFNFISFNSSGEESFGSDDELKALILLGVSSILALQVLILRAFGQPWISRSGRLQLWNGDNYSSENSQQLTDWYTFTHILHGFIFYYGTGYFQSDISYRFLIALGAETLWEVAENSPTIIERYRRTALAHGYTGDSIINSLGDTVSMSVGFAIAHQFSIWTVIALTLIEEIFLGWKIRDSFLLNVIQIIHPIKIISEWQEDAEANMSTTKL